ncbi:MAG TPA: triple tyrosine motif-containing protein, partial [Ignavibacteriaceae bacterium]
NAPEMNQYVYRMEGFDRDWITGGTRHYVTYTNLDPGDYVFHIKATNSDGKWNERETSIAVIIHPPFWGTWWFRTLLILFLVLGLYLIYRIRLKRMLEIERLRVRIASDLHDDIGSALTRISLESELLNSGTDPDENRAGLRRIGDMSREIISSMSDVVWSIDARNDSTEDLLNHMKDFAFSLFSLKNIHVAFETKNIDSKKKLKVDVRQNIYLIFKEAINNSVKYSKSNEIYIRLENGENYFQMIIHDPGSTLSTGKLTGQGLRNMQMRAERIGGRIEYLNNEGFKIIFTGEKL